MIILHSLAEAPKEVLSFLDDCREFYLCYVIDLRVIQKQEDGVPIIEKNGVPFLPKKPVKPEGLRITHDVISSSYESTETPIMSTRSSTPAKSPSPRPVLPPRVTPRPSPPTTRESSTRLKPPELPPKPPRSGKSHSAEVRTPPAKPPKPTRLFKSTKTVSMTDN